MRGQFPLTQSVNCELWARTRVTALFKAVPFSLLFLAVEFNDSSGQFDDIEGKHKLSKDTRRCSTCTPSFPPFRTNGVTSQRIHGVIQPAVHMAPLSCERLPT